MVPIRQPFQGITEIMKQVPTIGNLHGTAGDFHEALEANLEALAIQQRAYDDDHPSWHGLSQSTRWKSHADPRNDVWVGFRSTTGRSTRGRGRW